MFKVEKVFCDIISDGDVILTSTRKGNRYTKRYYVKGILHIVVTTDNDTQDIVEIKISKKY